MILSHYDRVVCLCVDHRWQAERGRVGEMLADHGVNMDCYAMFIDGEGHLYPYHMYDQFTPDVPSGWKHGKGAYAHFCAMKTVVEHAADEGIDNLLWIEDDCVFTPEFNDVVADATRQIMEQGIEYDLLYYGANHSWASTYEVSPNLLRCYGSLTTHCLGIPARSFEKILGLPPEHVIDKVIADRLHARGASYAVWPNVAVQKPGFSAISNIPCDYSDYFKSKGKNQICG